MTRRHRLAQQRQAAGHTQESLAERLGVDRTTVVRWENGKATPRPWQNQALARELGCSAAELRTLLDGSSDSEDPLVAPAASDADRLTSVADLRAEFMDLTRRYDLLPSSSLLAEAGQQLAHLDHLATQSRSGRFQRDVLTLQAETAILMGKLIWDASQRRDHFSARRHYSAAVGIARRLRDAPLEAHALLRSSYVDLYGTRDASAGLALAQAAADRAAQTSPALAGLALLHAGEAHAMLGDVLACERTIGTAQEQLAEADGSDAAADLIFPDQVGRLAGSCYLELGQLRRAQGELEVAVRELHARQKSRAIVLGNLALARIRQRNVDGALEVLDEAVDELEHTRGGGGMNLVFAAARELKPWRQESEVQDLHDRLLSLMAAP